jgi:hypothetical protein
MRIQQEEETMLKPRKWGEEQRDLIPARTG